MFRAKVDIGTGPKGIVKDEVYELEMIYANHTNLDKSKVELSSLSMGTLHIITSKQLNNLFEELD